MNKELLFGEPKWMFEVVFGLKTIDDCIKQNKELYQLLNETDDLFSTGTKGNFKFLVSKGYEHYIEYFNVENIQSISNKEAFDTFGIERMETAIDKIYSCIKTN